MIDIHHHLLPGVDDGSPDMETTIAMVRMAVDDGVTHIAATPHANNKFHYDRMAHEQLLQSVRQALPADLAGRITLGLGSDFHITFDNVEAAGKDPSYFSINGKGYLMVELPDVGIPPNLRETLYELRIAGMTPILTHPERNITIQGKPEIMKPWIEDGLLLQVTAGSLTGTFGPKAQKLAHDFLRKNWVHVLASDAHSLGRRNPRLSEAFQSVESKYGAETARRLFITNPLAAFEGTPVPPQPEPEGIFESDEAKSFLQRLLGR